jgi:hypothetical protein
MSIKLMTLVFDRYPKGGNERVLALALADNAADDGTRIWPSVATLAHKTLQSERNVQRQLKAMVASGWLLLVSAKAGRSNQYAINPAWIAGDGDCQGVTNCHPPSPQNTSGNVVHNSYISVDKLSTGGDTTGKGGDIAMSPEHHGTISLIPPISPVDTGDCGKLSNPKPKARSQTAKPPNPEQPSPAPRSTRPPWRWRNSASGIKATARHLGFPPWAEAAFNAGKGEPFSAYRQRVELAYDARYPRLREREAQAA